MVSRVTQHLGCPAQAVTQASVVLAAQRSPPILSLATHSASHLSFECSNTDKNICATMAYLASVARTSARPAASSRRTCVIAAPRAPVAHRRALFARGSAYDDAERAKRDAQRTAKDLGDMVRPLPAWEISSRLATRHKQTSDTSTRVNLQAGNAADSTRGQAEHAAREAGSRTSDTGVKRSFQRHA